MNTYTWMLAAGGIFVFMLLVVLWVLIRGPKDDDGGVLPGCFGLKPQQRPLQENLGCPVCPYYSSCSYKPRKS